MTVYVTMTKSRELIISIYFLLSSLSFCCTAQKQLLTGQWNVINLNESIRITGSVPGGIYSALTNAGILNDIYYGFNDIKYRWVGNETWIYTKTFAVDSAYLEKNQIQMIFDGLDTIAEIYINGKYQGKTNNMFVQYKYNVKSVLQIGKNKLSVKFLSPVIESQKLYEKQSQFYIVPPVCVPQEYNGECHVNHLRKMQASFGWDWGPAFPSVGIWKSVYLLSYNSVIVQDVTVNITDSNDVWKISLNVYLEGSSPKTTINGRIICAVTTDIDKVEIFTDVNATTNNINEVIQNISFSIPKGHVKLWWPNGYGSQSLYKFKISYMSSICKETSSKILKIGFRTVKLVQNALDNGLTFRFKINNIDIFAKGSNWIPANILPEKGSNPENVRFLLQSAKEAHMNMLRVWGGGVYESEEFYSIADELGIMIWQDFMFACSMYPVDKLFIESVEKEVEQQVRRLQHHASIVVWAGNNENEAALRGNWYGTRNNFTQYKKDYIKLYVETIKRVCLNNDKTRAFVVSSPSNGLQSEKEGYVAKNPYDSHYGDVHYYNYLLDGWNQNIYPKTRFASEYGFQSIPSMQSLRTATNITTDLVFGSDFLMHRQHHLGGYSEMKILINYNLKLPALEKDNYLNTFIYYSQISQAMAVKMETEHYRQWRNLVDSLGNGLTMGALYWQLNDVWIAPSWSSIDYEHRWKMLHYYARNFFAPILITANLNPARQLTIFAISDLTVNIYNVTLLMSVYKWDDFKPISVEGRHLNLLGGYSKVVDQFWIDNYLKQKNCGNISNAKQECFMYFEVFDTEGNKLAPDNFVYPAPLKSSTVLLNPNITVTVITEDENHLKNTNFKLIVKSDAIAPFVWLETQDFNGKFSENGFLQNTASKIIQFYSEQPVTPARLQSSITVTSLTSMEHL